MMKSKITASVLFAATMLLPLAAHCEDGVKWGSSEAKTRMPVEGTSGYYEPDNLQRDGDVIRFKMYESGDLKDTKVLGEYAINCEAREVAALVSKDGKSTWEPPSRLFAGDKLYALARELCGWGPGFWQRLAD